MAKLYIMRHGMAEAHAAGGDVDRALTAAGRAEVQAVARGLQQVAPAIARVFASPLRRTRETAELVAAALPQGGEATFLNVLAPGADPAAVLPAVASPPGDVLLVGHMPDVSLFVAAWARPPVANSLAFAPAMVACLDFAKAPAAGCATLLWVQPARQLAVS